MKLYLLALAWAAVLSRAEPVPIHDSAAINLRQSYIGQGCTNRNANNIYGTCQYTSTCNARRGTADTKPDCPGPDNVQCCVMDDCVNGARGTCLDTRQWNCQGNGGWNYGNHCPGGDTYICCQGDAWVKGGQRPI